MSFLTKIRRWMTLWLIEVLPAKHLLKLADQCLSVRNRLQERARQLDARARQAQGLEAFRSVDDQPLKRSVLEQSEAWRALAIPVCPIPGMLTDAEKQYYLYITQFYRGWGSVVELGTWLGMSTFYLLTGLRQNPLFQGQVTCVDDFVWRATSMNKWLDGTAIKSPNHFESFQPLFEAGLANAGLSEFVRAQRAKFADYYGNESLAPFKWSGGPIELCVVDCGRELHVNEAWYRELKPFFVEGKTLVVMQDWQNYKRVPEIHWEQTKRFTDGKPELDLIHEIRDGAVATFLYRSSSS